jgi:DNA-binding MarR family transcriptional regulator
LQTIARGLEQWYALLGRQFGPLSRPQRRVLAAVVRADEVRVGDLAEATGMTTAGATRMVDTLESLGYVRRFRLPHADQRQVYVALTAEGRTALAEAERVFVSRVQATVDALSDDERRLLARLLEAIAAGPQVP